MYTRAAASDYDDWAYQHENPGWSFADLLSLMKKVRVDLRNAQIVTDIDPVRDIPDRAQSAYARISWSPQGFLLQYID